MDAAGTYQLTASSAQGCLEDSSAFYVPEIYNYPNSLITADTLFECGVMADLTAHPSNLIYEWTGPYNFQSTDQMVSVEYEGMYVLEITDPATQCATQDSIYLPGGPCIDFDGAILPADSNIVIFVDNDPPVVTWPDDITVSCTDDIFTLDSTGEIIIEQDGCPSALPNPWFLDIVAGGACLGSLVYNRIWYVADQCGNLSFHTQQIHFLDDIPPYFTVPADITLECGMDINDLTVTGDVTDEGDDCDNTIGDAIFVDSLAVAAACTGNDIIYRNWELIDACGNEYAQTQLITFVDTIAPAITIPGDVTIACDQDPTNLSITGMPSDTSDNCAQTNIVVDYQDIASPIASCILNYNIERTWIATDGCGNSTTAIQQIAVIDDTPPVFDTPIDLTVSCDINQNDLGTLGDAINESDNCSTGIGQAVYRDSIVGTGPCPTTKTVVRIWSLADECGNLQETQQTLTFEDITDPTFTVPADVTLECGDDPNDLNQTGDVFDEADNCSMNTLDASYVDSNFGTAPCAGAQYIERLWTLTDDCGNQSTAIQTIVIEDTTPPTFSGLPQNPEVSCDSIGPPPAIGIDIIATDNCDTSVVVTYSETQTNIVCPDVYILRRVWTAEDDCGNVDSLVQELTFEDSSEPVILSFPPDITVTCDSIIPPGNAQAIDTCSANINVQFNEVIIDGTCDFAYQIIRTWTWIDDCGNSISNSQTVTVVDETSPEFIAPADTVLTCDANILDLNQTGSILNSADNCDPSTLDIDYRDSVFANYPCDGSRRILRIWSVSDTCGNESSQIQVIDLLDGTPPVLDTPGDVTISCDQDPNDLNIVGDASGSSDICDTNLDLASFQDSVVYDMPCAGSSVIYRHWSLADDCGNVSTGTQEITLLDTTAPSFTLPADVTISCDLEASDLDLTGDVTDESDNCQNNIGDALYSDSLSMGACGSQGVLFRTWTLSDLCGNATTLVQTITIQDTIAPTFDVPEDLTLDCTTDITDLTITGNTANNLDNCSTSTVTSSYQDSLVINTGCSSEQNILRIWTVSDDCGNESTAIQSIQLFDDEAPIFTTPVDLTVDCFADLADTTFMGSPTDISDNCNTVNVMVSYQDSINYFGQCPGTLTVLRNWIAVDDCGNVTDAYQIISVIDTIAPTFIAPQDVTLDCNTDPSDLQLTGELDSNLISGECSLSHILIFYEDSISTQAGCEGSSMILRKWIVRDACGNESEETQEISIEDTTGPTFTLPDDVTLDCSLDPNFLNFSGTVDSIYDNCSNQSFTTNYIDSIVPGNSCDALEYIYRTWTVADDCGNASTGVQVITLNDVLPPVFFSPADTVIHCTIDPTDLTITGIASNELDNCDPNIGMAAYSDSLVISDTCSLHRALYRTWSLSDNCGNLGEYLQIVYLLDTIGPSFTVPVDVTLSCDQDITDVNITGEPTDEIFNCQTQTGSSTYQDSILTTEPCVDVIIERTWTLSNGCDQDSSQIQLITIVDTLAPMLMNVPNDLTVDCGDPIPNYDPNFVNACNQNFTVTFTEDSIASSCLNQYLIIKKWVAVDDCGNADSTQQQITILGCPLDLVLMTSDDLMLCAGQDATFQITANDTTGLFYQWQQLVSPSVNWENIPGATQADYQLPSVQASNAGLYRCLVAGNLIDIGNDSCQVISPEIELQVTPPPTPTLVNEPMCIGGSIFINNTTFTAGGTYIDTLSTADGCDSIVQIVITEFAASQSDDSVSICVGDSAMINGQWYHQDTTIIDTIVNAMGCDSLHYQHLVTGPWTWTTDTTQICTGDSIFLGGVWQSQSGEYVDTILSLTNCDTIVNLTLEVIDEIVTDYSEIICPGDSTTIAGQLIFAAAQWQDTLVALSGCDSIVNYQVELYPVTNRDSSINLCYGDSVMIAGFWQFADTTVVITSQTADGCDSLTQILVDFTEPNFTPIQYITLCEGESHDINGITFTQNASYTDTLLSNEGCDSLIHYDIVFNPLDSTYLNEQRCAGDLYVFGNDSITQSGDYELAELNTNSCDSTVFLSILFLEHLEETIEHLLCPGDSVTFGGQTVFAAANWTDTLMSSAGCDSLITYDISVLQVADKDSSLVLCAGDSIQILGSWTFSDTSYTDTTQTANGCDSLTNYTVTFLNPYLAPLEIITLCQGESHTINGITFTENASYTDSLLTSAGCDSLLPYQFVFNPVDSTFLNEQRCAGEYFVFGTDSLYQSGDYELNLLNSYTCDSTVFLTLNFVVDIEQTIVHLLCPGDSVTLGNQTVFGAANWTDTLVSSGGCDSLVTFDVDVLTVEDKDSSLVICSGDSILIMGSWQFTDTSYTDTTQTVNGCDSMTNFTITFLEQFLDPTQIITLCEGESYMINGITFNENASYTDSLLSSSGCDSLVPYEFIFNPLDSTYLNEQFCVGDYYVFGPDTLYQSGDYQQNLTNSYDCDSTVFLSLNFVAAIEQSIVHILCPGDSVTLGSQTVYGAANWTDTLVASGGCDSLVNFDVSVITVEDTETDIVRCEGDSMQIMGVWQYNDGTFVDTSQTADGCDSVTTIHLSFVPSFNVPTQNIERCDGESVLINGISFTQDTSFIDTLTSFMGCDSLVPYQILFNPLDTTIFEEQICEGETYTFGSSTLNQTGEYELNLTNQFGCDSTVYLSLLVVESIEVVIDYSICPGDSVEVNGTWHYTSTDFDIAGTSTQGGCDSITMVSIATLPVFLDSIIYQICEGDSMELFDNYYSDPTTILEEGQTQNGCDSNIVHILEVHPATSLIVDDEYICKGDEVTLFAEGAEEMNWFPATGLSCTDCPNPIASPSETTTYTVSASSCLGTTSQQVITVYVYELPSIEIDAEASIVLGDTLALSWSSDNTSDSLQISWSTGSGEIICANNCPDSVLVTPQFGSSYTVTAMDHEGCVNQDNIQIHIKNECEDAEFFFPNFITPNGDNKNDEFVIQYEAVKTASLLRIFNRWGELVFETYDIDNEHWDGKFRGKAVNAGVFVFYLEGYCLNDLPFIETGNLTVIR